MPLVEEPLEKVTMNFYAKDIKLMREIHGYGYTEVIRRILRTHIMRAKKDEEIFHG